MLVGLAAPADAGLLPAGFFESSLKPGQGPAAVEADRLSYDGIRDIISAEGNVVLSYQGYTIRADRVQFNQRSGDLSASGSVSVTDPAGNRYDMESVELTGEMKAAFIRSLTLTTAAGATITAGDVRYADAMQTILTDAAYSPCGLCIDSKGRRIGWKIKAAKLTYDRDKASVEFEQPSLEFLGVQVAWLPWFWIPDPTQPRATGLRMPSLNYAGERGVELTVPYFVPIGSDIDMLLSPRLMSRQGFLPQVELSWRLPSYGEVNVKASGLYQLDKSAFAGKVGYRDWRGAIQTSARFTPAEHWSAGWSYSLFSDNAYLPDYALSDDKSSVNQVFGTYFDRDTWLDARIQRFNRLGDYTAMDDQQQGMAIPLVKAEHYRDLAPGWGRLHFSGELLGVHRELDKTATFNGVPYVFGFAGNKAHGVLEGSWENQVIAPGGLVATPFLGGRLDGAWYDGATANPASPPDSMLFTATPIAALDLRYPLMASNGGDTHIVEPIAQVVYRGSSTTRVGITNDDAQSFVFDTSNLFSYNKFSGIDRQETGLNANIGAHYLADFADGSWIDLVAGQSFHLLGTNAMGVPDEAQVGTSTGLGGTASYIVASARGGYAGGLNGAARVQIDPSAWRVTRAGVGVNYAPPDWFSAGLEYLYVAADPALGVVSDQHEVKINGRIPVLDYWWVDGGLDYDLGSMNSLKVKGGLTYDDGYLLLGVNGNVKPTSWGVGVSFKLKGPDGEVAF